MSTWSHFDRHRLRAAEGWLELGNPVEALAELEGVSHEMRIQPEVLHLRWRIHSGAKQWDRALAAAQELTAFHPKDERGWAALCKTLYFTQRILEAYDLAMLRLPEFRDSFELTYDAACYACLLGKLDQAEGLLSVAMKLNDEKQVRLYALADRDLERIWDRLRPRKTSGEST